MTDDKALAIIKPGQIGPRVQRLKGLVGDAYLGQIETTVRRYMAWIESENRGQVGIVSNIEDFYVHLKAEGLRDSTAKLHLCRLRRFVRKYAKDTGRLDLLPLLELVELPRQVQESPRRAWLDSNQAGRLLGDCDMRTVLGIRDKAILGLLLGAGLRRSEAASLTWGQIDFDSVPPMLIGLHTKGRTRDIPIPVQLGHTLKLWKETIEEDAPAGSTENDLPVFWSLTKGHRLYHPGLTAQAVWRVVEEHCRRIPVTVKDTNGRSVLPRPHDLRRTFARCYWDRGGDLVDLSTLLGHSSVTTTSAYIGAGWNPTKSDPGRFLSYAAALDGGDGR
jgi:integrase